LLHKFGYLFELNVKLRCQMIKLFFNVLSPYLDVGHSLVIPLVIIGYYLGPFMYVDYGLCSSVFGYFQ
jgi:hypothetical protein